MCSLKTTKGRRGRPHNPRIYRLDRFTLHLENAGMGSAPSRWRVSGRNLKGSYQRVRFDANSFEEAKEKAESLLFSRTSEEPDLTVAEAFVRMIGSRNIKAETRYHYRQFASYFCSWLEQERGITEWKQIAFEDVHAYIASLVTSEKAAKTISHYMEPVRFTSRWLSQMWPDEYRDFCAGLRIPSDTRRLFYYKDQQPPGYLTIAEVCDLLDWIGEHHPHADVLRPGVALQGLCGLQLQEALRLTAPQVDLDLKTITIEGEVKNHWRVRRLPVPALVMEILRRSIQTTSPDDLRIVRYQGVHWKAYSSLVTGALDKWSGGRRPIPPKDLRNTLPTEATNGGWAGYFLNRYLGHSPQSMAERHYHGEVSRKGQGLVELLREKVVKPIELLVSHCTILHDEAKVIDLGSAS